MSQEIQGSLVVLWLSDTGSNFKLVTCEETSQLSATANVTVTKTKCGPFTAVDTPEKNLSGSGVVDGDPAANQVSYKQLDIWLSNKTRLWFIYQNLADVALGLTKGEAVYQDGFCYLTEVTVTAQEGDLVKFNWAIATTGTVDTSSDS
jgi:hypothetical protein